MTNPLVNAALEAVKMFLVALGVLMVALNLGNTPFYAMLQHWIGMVMVVGTAAWGVFQAGVLVYRQMAAAIQAGINLTVSGKAVDASGAVISQNAAPGATPPKPVTVETAKAIMADFAPPPSTISKS